MIDYKIFWSTLSVTKHDCNTLVQFLTYIMRGKYISKNVIERQKWLKLLFTAAKKTNPDLCKHLKKSFLFKSCSLHTSLFIIIVLFSSSSFLSFCATHFNTSKYTPVKSVIQKIKTTIYQYSATLEINGNALKHK